jgi:hypothetical protein
MSEDDQKETIVAGAGPQRAPLERVTLPRNPLEGYKDKIIRKRNSGILGFRSSRLAKAKEIAWRLSALYCWAWVIADLMGQHDRMRDFVSAALRLPRELLQYLGFSPADPGYFPFVVKASWLLAITGFSSLQLFGFMAYIILFPLGVLFWVLIKLLGKSGIGANEDGASQKPKRGRIIRIPWLGISLAGLVAWSLLYGRATSIQALDFGLPFSALLLLVLFSRFFRRVRPIGEEDAAMLQSVERWASIYLSLLGAADVKNKTALRMYKRIARCGRWLFHRLAVVVRGGRGRDRISIYVLFEYAFSAVAVGASAILFWGFVARRSLFPTAITIQDAIEVAASHFIPGLSIQSAEIPSFWVSFGAGVTAWVLFVIVIAPAGSVLPIRQSVHAKRLALSCKIFRIAAQRAGVFGRWIGRLEKFDLPETSPKK